MAILHLDLRDQKWDHEVCLCVEGGGGGWVVSIMKCGSLLCVGVGRGG